MNKKKRGGGGKSIIDNPRIFSPPPPHTGYLSCADYSDERDTTQGLMETKSNLFR